MGIRDDEVVKKWTNKSQVSLVQAQHADGLHPEQTLKWLEAIYYEMRLTNAILIAAAQGGDGKENEE